MQLQVLEASMFLEQDTVSLNRYIKIATGPIVWIVPPPPPPRKFKVTASAALLPQVLPQCPPTLYESLYDREGTEGVALAG